MTHAARSRCLSALVLSGSLLGCSHETRFLGFDETSTSKDEISNPEGKNLDAGPSGVGPAPEASAGAGGEPSQPGQGGGGGEGGRGGAQVEAGGGGEGGGAGAGQSAGGAGAEASGGSGVGQEPDAGPGGSGDVGSTVDLPNHLVDVLGSAPSAVERRIEEAFQQLFHGDESTEAIYVEVGDGSAYIHDVYHDDTRADALGYGLLVSVLLDKQPEFDSVWQFVKKYVQYADGPNAGYLHSMCDKRGDPCADDVGVFGAFHAVTALLLAEARWGDGDGIYDYGAEAGVMLDAFRNKEMQNGDAIVDGVISTFGDDPLPVRDPTEDFAGQTAPGSLMPGYFEYWGERTGDSYWHDAAERARELLRTVANPDNGLTSDAVYFDGTAVDGESDFREPSYSVAFNIAVDTAWYHADPEQVDMANHRVRFFNAFGGSYPALYTYDGEPLNQNPSGALVAQNGMVAGIATVPARDNFIRTVWDSPIQTGAFRYFDGINQLLALMYLAGDVKPYY